MDALPAHLCPRPTPRHDHPALCAVLQRAASFLSIAMIFARTLGMTANRVIDRHIDSKNPRNAVRHLPAGKLSVIDMKTMAVVSLGMFLVAAYQLNMLSLVLAPVAAAYLIFYPYTKRFTWTANLLLGIALSMAPIAAWIGIIKLCLGINSFNFSQTKRPCD